MNSSKWWREHRKRQKPKPIHVVRQTFRQVLREYTKSCSVAGVKQMCDSDISFTQRLIRISVFSVMFGGIFYFLMYMWYGNLANPLIVVMESSNYPISNIEFPAITLCNFNRISKRAIQRYLTKYRQQSNSEREGNVLLKQMQQMGRLIDFSYNKSVKYDLLLSFISNLGQDINTVMEELAPSCDEMLIKCAWAGEIQNCTSIFDIQRTARGYCCAFNHVLNYTIKRSKEEKYIVKRQNKPGLLYGLNVILDAMVEDYAYAMYNMHGFEVLIFDSSNFGDPTSGRMVQRISQPGYISFFEIKSVKQIATREVRKYPATTRKCFFHDENKHRFGDLYSYSYCIMGCRIRAIQSLCKCTPFYFPITGSDVPICSMNDLGCLNKHIDKMTYIYPLNALNHEGLEGVHQDALRCSECLPDCELTRYHTKHSKTKLSLVENNNKEFVEYFFDGANMSNKGLLSIYLARNTGVLNRLDIVSYWYEIISNIGGFCSILVGFSFISILEFFYFFIFRFSFNLYLYYVNNK